MYLGRIVETGETAEVLARPLHPYTRALLNAVPASHPRLRRERRPLEGDPPSPSDPPSGCRFHPRCPIAVARCATEVPVLEQIAGGSFAACHRAGEAIDSNSIRQEPQ
jgi:oligopeptide/dipeptide ABC transporter ATP-binding protein